MTDGQRSLAGCSPCGHRVGCDWAANRLYSFPGGAGGKEPPASAGGIRDSGSIPGSGRPWSKPCPFCVRGGEAGGPGRGKGRGEGPSLLRLLLRLEAEVLLRPEPSLIGGTADRKLLQRL